MMAVPKSPGPEKPPKSPRKASDAGNDGCPETESPVPKRRQPRNGVGPKTASIPGKGRK